MADDNSTGQGRNAVEIVAHVARRTFTPLSRFELRPPSTPVLWAVKYVMERFKDDVTVDDIARSVGLSKYHFIRKFRRETGLTPGLFLQRYRIVRAMNMLVSTDRNICTIAREVGYRDPAAFTRAFVKTTGTTPYLYRQTHRLHEGAGRETEGRG